ncbi:MAG: phytanoyl-CoA dioxygenase family protein [Myxococcales bacterium]|nr:phytanoyl-CoA dioxygenase family protein [Myxococcales bacterium]
MASLLDPLSLQDPSFWKNLCPSLSLSLPKDLSEDAQGHAGLSCLSPEPREISRCQSQLCEDGYFLYPSRFARDAMGRLARAVECITDATGMPIWTLVYDELWEMMAAMQGCLAPLLGESYQLLPDIWVWNLRPNGEDRGWRPHRDRERGSVSKGQLPKLLSVWLPLTDATPDNGCIYVLPASLDKRYHQYGQPNEEGSLSLQDVRALPAPAGSVLGWSAQLLHWGGRTSPWAEGPRISVAFEFQAQGFAGGAPFVLPPQLPDFSMRLGLIARQLLQYRHMAPLSKEMERVCRQLADTYLPKKRRFSDVLARMVGKRDPSA